MMSDTEPAATETELETPIKVRWTGYTRNRIYGYNLDFDTEKSDRVVRAMDRQKTNVVIRTVEEGRAMASTLANYTDGEWRSRTWMNAQQGKACDRVHGEVIDALEQRGVSVENRDSPMITTSTGEDSDDEDADPGSEPEDDASADVVEQAREIIADHGEVEISSRIQTYTATDPEDIQMVDGGVRVENSVFSPSEDTEVSAVEDADGEDDDGLGPLFGDSE